MPVRDTVEVRICSPKPLYAGELMFIVQPVPTRAVAITLTVGECAALCSAALFGAFARSMQARPVWRAACMPALRRAARLKPDMRRGRALSAQPYHARSSNAHRGERICLKARAAKVQPLAYMRPTDCAPQRAPPPQSDDSARRLFMRALPRPHCRAGVPMTRVKDSWHR